MQALAVGAFHACALVNGDVQCWGYNSTGPLGNNATVSSAVAVPVLGLGSGVQAIVAGAVHSCALVNGSVWCWGNNIFGQLGINSTTHKPGRDAGGWSAERRAGEQPFPVPVEPWAR